MLHRVQDLTGIEPCALLGQHVPLHRQPRPAASTATRLVCPKNFTILKTPTNPNRCSSKSSNRENEDSSSRTRPTPSPGPLFNVLSLARNTQNSVIETVERQFQQYSEIKLMLPALRLRLREEEARGQGVVDYDDLLELWLELLRQMPRRSPPTLPSASSHVLVDEYQDTNTIQSQIIERPRAPPPRDGRRRRRPMHLLVARRRF